MLKSKLADKSYKETAPSETGGHETAHTAAFQRTDIIAMATLF
jgi:hypothetical protein